MFLCEQLVAAPYYLHHFLPTRKFASHGEVSSFCPLPHSILITDDCWQTHPGRVVTGVKWQNMGLWMSASHWHLSYDSERSPPRLQPLITLWPHQYVSDPPSPPPSLLFVSSSSVMCLCSSVTSPEFVCKHSTRDVVPHLSTYKWKIYSAMFS